MSKVSEKIKWMSNGCLRSAPKGEIDAGKGVIGGVSVCTVGEAKGHGVNLDSEFIETVAKFGNEKKQGLKARFGHPNMCSTALGTFIGRFKNFSVVGDQVIADLFLSNSAKETPNGDLYAYVMKMAEENPDMFGTSIVFTPGKTFVKGEDGEKIYDYYEVKHGIRFTKTEYQDLPVFVECSALHACDTVDEPAANDGGLFSAFSGETISGQITEFLDLNPEVWGALESNPDILQALSEHGDKMDGFMNSYRDYREQTGGTDMSDKEDTNAESLEEKPETIEDESTDLSDADEGVEDQSDDSVENGADESVEDEGSEESASDESGEELGSEETVEELSREDFKKIVDEFGAEIAAQTVLSGGTYVDALAASHKALKAENEALREGVDAKKGGSPAKVVAAQTKKPLFKVKS